MADFISTTACNDPKIKNHEAVERIIASYYTDPDFQVGVGFDEESGEPYLFAYGYVWPEAWKLPDGTKREDFDPCEEDRYEEGDDGFIQLLLEIAPHLAESLTVQAIGSIKCRFPLAAGEWHLKPGGRKVRTNGFRASDPVLAVS